MKFVKLTFSYLYKNFLYLFLFSIIPAVFLGTTLSPFKVIEFINRYSQDPVLNFDTIFNGMVNFSWLQLLFVIISIVLLAIFISAILGQMEQHFRSGKLNLEALKEHVNNNILLVLANIVALFVLAFVVFFVASAILFLTHLLLSGINTSPTVFNVVVANVILSVIFIFYALFAGVILINTANMLTDGSEFRYSFSDAIKLTQKNGIHLILAMLLPFIIIAVFVSIFVNSPILPVINVLGVLFSIMYYTSLAMTGYFELAKLDRYDNRKRYYNR